MISPSSCWVMIFKKPKDKETVSEGGDRDELELELSRGRAADKERDGLEKEEDGREKDEPGIDLEGER